jgi:lipopolysaccharide export system protein LptC
MSPARRNWILLLIAATAFMVLFRLPDVERPTPALPPELAGEPDLYLRDVVILQHEEDGSVRYRMRAYEVRHFETLGLTSLQAPRLTLYRGDEPPWHLQAERGDVRVLMHPDGTQEEVVYLRDDVEVQQQANDERFLLLTTDVLHLYPDRRYAETDRAVMIQTNAGHTQGVGLRADLIPGVFVLGADSPDRVHTVVLPAQPSRDS